ncbi:dextranase [Paenibacillus mucilaginosus]|uniref:glycoside hydrolase family 66 protein n=1 Tax=Paenibacillus mucilaginosus TaxID=61624 RepID=UPI003D2335E3
MQKRFQSRKPDRKDRQLKKKIGLSAAAVLVAVQGFAPLVWGSSAVTVQAEAQAAGQKAQNLPAKPLTAMTIGKARYAPGEKAAFTLSFEQGSGWSGKIRMEIYQANTLVAAGKKAVTVMPGTNSDLTVEWQPPADDFRGYLAKAWIEGREDQFVTAALDVSSDWTHFPRYGFVGEFPQETPEQSDAKMKQLSQEYYLNGYQFYDWMWRHDVSVYSKTNADGTPVRDAQGNFVTAPMEASTSYPDLLGRTLYPLSVKQQVASAQKYGSAAMAYEMNYAARENYQAFGVKPEWGLYKKTAPTPPDPGKDQVGFFFDGVKPKPTGLYLQDPGHPDWQSYITEEYNRAVNEFGFDGIHLDQWGANDNDYLLDYYGRKRYYSLDYSKLIGATKASLEGNHADKAHVAFNMVGGNAGYSTVTDPQTKTDFDYSELWQDMNLYKDVQKVVYDTRSKNGGKAMVIAGYMNYKEAAGIPYSASEAQDVPKTLAFQSRIGKSPSWVGDFGKKDEDAIVFNVHVPAAGEYDLTLRYGHGNSGGNPEGRLSVNGSVAVPSIPFDEFTDWGNPVAEKTVTAQLQQGKNEIRLQLNSNDLWLNVRELEVSAKSADAAAFGQTVQAVFAELVSCKVDNYGRVYYFETQGDYVEFEVDAAAAGEQELIFSYGAASQAVERALDVNGEKLAPVSFAPTGSVTEFKEGAAVKVPLKQGTNTIRLMAEGSDPGLNLQYLRMGDNYYMAEAAKTGWAPTQEALIRRVPASPETGGTGYIDGFRQQGDFVRFETAPVETGDGEQELIFTYRNPGAAAERVVYVDGRKAGTLTLAPTGEAWRTAILPVRFAAGQDSHEVTVKMEAETAAGAIALDRLEVQGQPLQAEEALTGWEPVVPRRSSVEAVPAKTDNFGRKGQALIFEVDVTEPAETLDFTYRTGNNPVLSVEIDGQTVDGAAAFPATSGGWDGAMAVKTVRTPVAPGKHTVKVTMESDGQYINLSSLAIGRDEYGIEQAALIPALPADGAVQPVTGYAGGFDQDGDVVTFETWVPEAGEYRLAFRYGSDAAYTVTRDVYVGDGEGRTISFAPTGHNSWGSAEVNGVVLQAGSNAIAIRVNGADDEGIRLDHLKLSSAENARIYEAEKANVTPAMELYKDTVLNFGHIGDEVSFDVEVPQDGETSIIYTYSNAGPTTYRSVYVDGQRSLDPGGQPGRVTFEGTGGSEKYSEDGYFVIPHLTAGKHRITLKMEEGDGKGSINLRAATLGYFNEPSLRLMDAGLAAMGATHIEVGTAEKIGNGPNLIAHEYFPNRSKKVLNGTKETLKEYYKFFAAYENLLFDSREDMQASIAVSKDGAAVPLSRDGAKHTLWYTVRKNAENKGFERYDVLHLVNLLNNDDNWRNAASEPAVQQNLQITYPIGIREKEAKKLKVYAATPDAQHGLFKELKYKWSGTNLVIDLPDLSYWSMIYIDREPQQNKVDRIFRNEAGASGHDGGEGQEAGESGRLQGTVPARRAGLQE